MISPKCEGCDGRPQENKKDIAIKDAIKTVHKALDIYLDAASHCKYLNAGRDIMDMTTRIAYPGCNHPKGVQDIASCRPDRCPMGKGL